MKILLTSLAMWAILSASGAAQAVLIDRGGGLIYDTDLNITWLQNANLGGTRNWQDSMEWVSSLNYYDSVRDFTYSDWRLPAGDVCLGYGCSGGEMGHLFHNELGGLPGYDIESTHNISYALFKDVYDFGNQYWTSRQVPPHNDDANIFYFNLGYSNNVIKSTQGVRAWAVRDGDVIAFVPEPAPAWLLGAGLLSLMVIAGKRKVT